MKELISLFLVFARIGGFTFGGGYAMLPLLQREVVENKGWAEEEELMDYYAVGQCTPGVIAVNVATFVGYKQKGFFGAVFATAGVIAPSVAIIGIIAAFLQNFIEYEVVAHAFAGIRVCVCVLILNAILKLAGKSIIDKASFVIFAAVLILSVFTSIPVAALVVVSGFAGYGIKSLSAKSEKEEV